MKNDHFTLQFKNFDFLIAGTKEEKGHYSCILYSKGHM